MDPNYNLNNNNTNGVKNENTDKIDDIKVDIPDYSINIEQINIDISKYKNNKPTREVIRGKLLNE